MAVYYRWNGAWGYLRFDALNLYYVHGRWYSPDTGLFLSPAANGEYLYGSGQDAINKVWTQFVTGAAYQALKNNADALALVLFVSPGYRTLYEQTFNNLEETLPDTFPFRFGRLFGTTVTLIQGFGEITTFGPGLVAGGSATTCLATAGGGCIPGTSVSTAAGGAVIVHGLSVEAVSLSNGSRLIIAFAKKSGTENTPAPTERHHLLPRQFKREFERAGLNIEDYVKELPRDFHKDIHGRGGGEHWINSWNQQWKRFFDLNRNPSASEILHQLEKMKREFGIP